MPHKGRLALVTGGSRGIGRGIVLELARAGYNVLINYARNRIAALECRDLCRKVAPSSPPHYFKPFLADISTPKGREKLVKHVSESEEPLEILINNAGVAPSQRMDILEASESSFDRLIEINIKAPYFLTQAIANQWIARRKKTKRASIQPKVINISSISAYTASVSRGDYCISKAAISMMTALYATRLAGHGIGVYEIRPGIIATDMTAPVKKKYDHLIAGGLTPIRRWGTPEDVGKAVAAIAGGFLPFSTGEVINVDGGFHIRQL